MPEPAAAERPIFRLDGARQQLTADGEAVALQPKVLALLFLLVENAPRVVSRSEMVDAVWDGLAVSGAAIRYAVRELRRGLGDSATEPLFVETVSRRGWCFVGRATRVSGDSWILEGRAAAGASPTSALPVDPSPFVGRDAEMSTLLDLLSRAQSGERRVLFVRGEPGIGKSRLLGAFLETANARSDTLVARGECVEHIGAGMPYAPLFDVLEQIAERLGGALPVERLRRHAPTWLAQMPSLTEPTDRASLEERIQGATQVRMVREWARAIEAFAEERTIVLSIEDLHWADPSTLVALLFSAVRTERARVLIVATLRPDASSAELADLQHGIEELSARESCALLVPGGFDLDSVRAYLGARFGADEAPARSSELCALLLSASGGNPLFLASLVDEFVETGRICEREGGWEVAARLRLDSVPQALSPLIEQQLHAVEEDLRDLLSAASVAGMDFSAAELSAALGRTVDDIEADCEELVSDGRFVGGRGAVAWPDGTVSSGYRFRHDLHRNALQGGLSPGRLSRIHRAIGERLAVAYAGREGEVAARLAAHFEQGLEPAAAAQYHALAGETSARRFSNFEAVGHLRRAIEIMGDAAFDGREALEIPTRLAFCAPLASVVGYAAPELEENLVRLEALTETLEDSPPMFPALLGLWSLHFVRADFGPADAFGERMLALAQTASSPPLRLQAHQSIGHGLFYRGEVLDAQANYDAGLEGYDLSAHERQDYSVGDDPLVLVLSCRALSLWFLGRADEASRSADDAVRCGQRLEHPPSLALAWTYGAVLHQLRGDAARARQWSDQALEITTAEGLSFWMELARIIRGWAIAHEDPQEGVALIRSGIAGWSGTGARLGMPHFLSLLASSLASVDDVEQGLETLEAARRQLAPTGQQLFRSQIDRFEGDLLRRRAGANGSQDDLAAARRCYLRAVEEADARGLRANVLQARLALADLDGPGSPSGRRLADVVARYPSEAPMDFDLARARQRLSSRG